MVDNFFWKWIKGIDVKRFGDNLQILPTTNAI